VLVGWWGCKKIFVNMLQVHGKIRFYINSASSLGIGECQQMQLQ
jgi:hypothetical protein